MLKIFECIAAFVFLTFLYPNADGGRYAYRYENGYENREELVIGNVTSYDRFELGRGVSEWESVTIDGKNYAVGLMATGICIFSAEMDANGSVIVRNTNDLSHKIVDIELVKYWNSTSKIYEPILVLVTDSFKLKWFKITPNLELIKLWEWSLHKKVVHINIFKFENMYHLLVLTKQSFYTADLYRFTLDESKHFWLSQELQLRYVSKSSTFNTYESNYFLTIPQNGMVCIFKYENERFRSFENFSSPNVDAVSSFNLGLKSYLLVTGEKVGIYKFNNYGIAKENVENMTFDGINYWLSMKLTTYRDEIVLLGQRILDHGVHKSKKIEVIFSAGDKFLLHEEIPCRYYGELLNGIDCLVEEENHNTSISGSAALFFGRTLGIVVPRKDLSSGLFLLHIDTRPTPNPIKRRMSELTSLKTKLEQMVKKRKESIREIQQSKFIDKIDQSGVKLRYSESEKIVPTSPAYSTTTGNLSFTLSSEGNFLGNFESKVRALRIELENVKRKLETAVRKDAERIYVKDLMINGIIAIKGKSRIKDLTVTQIKDTTIDALLTNFVRVGDNKTITGTKTFSTLHAERIDVQTINGRNVSDMVFRRDSEILNLKGDLTIEKRAVVKGNVTSTSGKINDNMDLSQVLKIDDDYEDYTEDGNLIAEIHEIKFDIVETNILEAKFVNKLPIHNNYIGNVKQNAGIESQEVHDILYIPGNLNVTKINGENLQDILDGICMRNGKITIPGTTIINGNVNVTNNAQIDYLNGVKYPEEYVFEDAHPETEYIEFTGNKHFETEITATTLYTRSGINGINTKTIIKLTDNQTIPGSFTFADLNVSGDFNVLGNITGIPDIRPNPTIKETHILTADVNFKVLEIEGTLTIGNSINGTNLERVLEDVVFKNEEEEIIITSIKEFPKGLTIKKDTEIDFNEINGISIDSFVHRYSDQQPVKINILNGNVTFKNLYVAGLIGGINITRLNEETVKLSGEQFISSTLNFFNEIEVTEDFKIKELLNDIAPDHYVYKTGDRTLPFVNSLEDVTVDMLIVEGDFKGKISNFDVDGFDERRLSLSKQQRITEKYFLKNLQVETLNASKINNFNYRDLTDSSRYHQLLLNRILDNKIAIKELKIIGNLTIQSINNISMDDILKTCLYLGEDKLSSRIMFDNVEFNTITIKKLDGVDFDTLIANLVFKNETSLVFDLPVLFEDGFEVTGYIETATINHKPIENILRKTGKQKILGPLVIKGNVSIESDTTIGENLNQIPMRYLTEVFDVIDDDTYRINGEVVFDKIAYIDNLVVNGFINGKNWSKFMEEVIGRNDDAIIPGVTNFLDEVQIRNNLNVMEGINNKDLSKFADNVVFTIYDTYIQGLVSFAQPVQIKEELIIESDLSCETVMGIDVRDWWKKAVFINRGLIEGVLHFEDVTIRDFVSTQFLNSINMSNLIPLRTNQYIPKGLYFQRLSATQEIIVDNLVNDVKLEPEFSNTVLNEGIQEITSEIEFDADVVVYNNLLTTGSVNGVNLSKVVTLDTDQNLTATYSFDQKTIMHSNLLVHGLINNINISDWNDKALRKDSGVVQNIEAPLVVGQNVTFENDLIGEGAISDLDFEVIENTIRSRELFKTKEEKLIIEGYSEMCDNVNHLLYQTKSQIYKFKYFDYLQFLHFSNDVGVILNFQHESLDYMLVNEINSCKSHLFSWSVSGYSLIRDDIETGIVSQFIAVKDKNSSLYLIGRSDEQLTSCSIEGTNVWKFENAAEILHVYKLEDLLLLQVSKIPGTFYGFTTEYALEFNIKSYIDSEIRRIRKWKINSINNLAYMPHNVGTGLALRDGRKIFTLLKEGKISNDQPSLNHNLEEIIVENVIEEPNVFVPGRSDGDFVVLNVGRLSLRTLTAVSQHEDTTVKGRFDFITIYDDIFHGKIFHKIASYKPTSLISLDFGKNGETLLIFLENEEVVQIYEYKGIEGFKYRSTIKEEGQKLIQLSLPLPPSNKLRSVLAVINGKKLTLMEAVMDGDSMHEEYLECSLPYS